MGSYTRKTLAEKLGIGIETLRYYERLGMIPPPRREANGYRRYCDADVANIEHILAAKKYGFTLKEMMDFRRATEGADRDDIDIVPFLEKKLEEVRSQVSSLESMAMGIEALIESMSRARNR